MPADLPVENTEFQNLNVLNTTEVGLQENQSQSQENHQVSLR